MHKNFNEQIFIFGFKIFYNIHNFAFLNFGRNAPPRKNKIKFRFFNIHEPIFV